MNPCGRVAEFDEEKRTTVKVDDLEFAVFAVSKDRILDAVDDDDDASLLIFVITVLASEVTALTELRVTEDAEEKLAIEITLVLE